MCVLCVRRQGCEGRCLPWLLLRVVVDGVNGGQLDSARGCHV